MTAAARLPPPPRRVRWRAALAPGWPLGALAVIAASAGLALLSAAGPDALRLPFDDLALDASRSTATGVVTAQERRGRDLARVRYAFTDPHGRRIEGASWARGSGLASGQECVVEFLADEPHVNRLQGTLRARRDVAVTLPLGLLVLPAVCLVLVWLRGAMRVRVLLALGREADATILAVRALPVPVLRRIVVEYAFTDEHGQRRSGRQWCARAPQPRAVAVHDPQHPARSRLATASDFAAQR